MKTMDNSFSGRRRALLVKAAKGLHLIGFVLFLGGILGTIVMSAVAGSSADLLLIYHQRQFVSGLAWGMIVPGMWTVILTGFLMALLGRYDLRRTRWLALKTVLAAIILMNGMLILVPLVGKVTYLAAESAAQGALVGDYLPLKLREDLFGTANFLMILTAAVLGVFKPGGRQSSAQGSEAGLGALKPVKDSTI